MSSTEDQKLLKGIKDGDNAVINTFYKKNFDYVKGYILRNSGSETDVEDVFQDALVLIYQKLKMDSLELSSSLRTYFYAICKNMWRNKVRKNKNLAILDAVDEDHVEQNISIAEDIENREREQVYRKHFFNLSDTCRELLELVFEGKSMKEIAVITGYAEGYTRKKKFECKKSLLEMIEGDPIYQELKETSEK